MGDKLPVLTSYALFGVLIGLAPILLSLLPQPSIQPKRGPNKVVIGVAVLIAAMFAALFSISNGAAFVGACTLLAFLASFRIGGVVRIPIVLGAFAGLLISATLPWWRRTEGFLPVMSWNELALFILIIVSVLYLLTITREPVASQPSSRRFRAAWLVPLDSGFSQFLHRDFS